MANEQAAALQRAKRQALGLLLLVTGVFIISSLLERSLWTDALQATAEAAMVGALADWFAVRALFHRVPIPWVVRHTAIIPRNKDRIGQNLAVFVRDRFLDPASLVGLLRRHDVVERMAQWLLLPDNARYLGQQVARMLAAALDMVQDRQIEHLLRKALRALLGRIDLTQTLARVLEALTHQGRHQGLLDDALRQLMALLQTPDTRSLIARTIIHWLKKEHPLKEKMLPSDWLSDQGASLVANALEGLLAEVAHNPQHQLRHKFDEAITLFITRLQNDPTWAQKGEQIRRYLQTNPTLGRYVQELWQSTRNSLQRDLANEQSALARHVRNMGLWLGQALAQDAALRQALNERLEQWAKSLAPEVSQFVAQHIQDTVQRWDAQDMAQLIELNIGTDLQYIRINGTIVGGLIGLLLFGLTHAPAIGQALFSGKLPFYAH